MKKATFRIYTGFDSYFSISSDELHKAYYLYLHPEKRTIFKDGNAIEGKLIMRIAPDYHAMMGYNPSHKLDSDDWNHIQSKDLISLVEKYMVIANDIAHRIDDDKKLWHLPLSQINVEGLDSGVSEMAKTLSDKFTLK